MTLEVVVLAFTSAGMVAILGAIFQAVISRQKMIAIALRENDREKITAEQVDRERNLELRDMFDVSEPEWHLLNEAAGEPDYYTQNKLPDWGPKCQPFVDKVRQELDISSAVSPVRDPEVNDLVCDSMLNLRLTYQGPMQEDAADIVAQIDEKVQQGQAWPPPTNGRRTRLDWGKTE